MRDEFEQAIFDEPDQIENHAVYADWLLDQGDPRGELIQLQLSLEDSHVDPFERAELQVRETELLEDHAYEWLGSLADLFLRRSRSGQVSHRRDSDFSFSRGWLNGIRADRLYSGTARRLVEAPEARLMQSVVVEDDGDGACHAMRYSSLLPSLRELDLSFSGVTDQGGRDLLESEGLADLLVLDLTGNRMSANICLAIENICPHAELDDQSEPEYGEFYDGVPE